MPVRTVSLADILAAIKRTRLDCETRADLALATLAGQIELNEHGRYGIANELADMLVDKLPTPGDVLNLALLLKEQLKRHRTAEYTYEPLIDGGTPYDDERLNMNLDLLIDLPELVLDGSTSIADFHWVLAISIIRLVEILQLDR